jgi:low molecular weight protein-tyrosine phosphatase
MAFSALFVCTGNICRSPMAAALLARRLSDRVPATKVESAGLAALVGAPADPLAIDLMGERNLDLTGHRARQLTLPLATGFDLILVMDLRQQRDVERMLPVARGRVHRVGRFGGFDVPDPYRRGRAAFEESLAFIERGIAEFARAVWRVE